MKSKLSRRSERRPKRFLVSPRKAVGVQGTHLSYELWNCLRTITNNPLASPTKQEFQLMQLGLVERFNGGWDRTPTGQVAYRTGRIS